MIAAVTVEEAAVILRYDPESVRRMLRAKQLKGWGRPWRLPVQQFLDKGFSMQTIEDALSAAGKLTNGNGVGP